MVVVYRTGYSLPSKWTEGEKLIGRIAVHAAAQIAVCFVILYAFTCGIPAFGFLAVLSFIVPGDDDKPVMITVGVLSGLSFFVSIVQFFTCFILLHGFWVDKLERYKPYLFATAITVVGGAIWMLLIIVVSILLLAGKIKHKNPNSEGLGLLFSLLGFLPLYLLYVFFCYYVPVKSYYLLQKSVRSAAQNTNPPVYSSAPRPSAPQQTTPYPTSSYSNAPYPSAPYPTYQQNPASLLNSPIYLKNIVYF
ncbi:hypothetical protein M3Y97_01135700 [Aphelenchoides bicaudatus]|nr:hypothetical protein M3Y97_01135700 [Aphelenchoides bicaudatus]